MTRMDVQLLGDGFLAIMSIVSVIGAVVFVVGVLVLVVRAVIITIRKSMDKRNDD